MNIGIFTADSNGCYPVPASKGGAVSTLVESLVKKNNEEKLVNMEVVSFFEPAAYEISKKYTNITFHWIRPWRIIKTLDNLTFLFIKNFTRKKAISYKSIWSLLFYIYKSSQIIRKKQFDKVVFENNVPMAWIIKLSKYSGDFYYHFHNVPRINAKAKDVFSKCTGFLCVSQFVGDCISSASNPIGPIAKHKVKILHNCIDTNKFSFDESKRKAIREKYGIKEDTFLIIFVGRLSEEKGIDVLLDALKDLSEDFLLMIVGSYLHDCEIKDHYQMKIKQKADDLGDKVIWTGFIKQSEVADYYCAADVAVLPSMWDEPAGLTMLEAISCGTPVITTNSGGIPEYMSNKAFVLERDSNLSTNIRLVINRIKNQEMHYDKKNLNNYVVKNFSADDYLSNFLKKIT